MGNLKELEAARPDKIKAIIQRYVRKWLSKPALHEFMRISGGRMKMILLIFLVAVLPGCADTEFTPIQVQES
jgi:hypothetical protein